MAENSKLTGIELNGVLYSLGKSIYEELDMSLVRFAELLGRDFYCPTLSSAPTSSTLKYLDTDGMEQTFQIGQPCRWAEENDYRIAVCKHVTSKSSSWYILPTKVSELANDSGYLTQHQDISHLATKSELNGKQAVIDDLGTIRSNAAKGATALQSVPSEYVTETELSNKGYATTASVNTGLGNKVDKVDGKQLSTEDFTTVLKNKLNGLSNYDDTTITAAVNKLRTDFDTLVSGDTTAAIKSFNDIVAFLDGLTDSEDLDSIIASIEQQIAGKQDKITDLETIRSGAGKGATAVQPTDLAKVATSGSYDDLGDKPIIPDSLSDLTEDASHRTVTDTEKATWNAKSNFSGSYNDLSNKPTIPSAVTESTVSGWGFTKNEGTYSKPSTGIPKSDLASAVQTSLEKADSALDAATAKSTYLGISDEAIGLKKSGYNYALLDSSSNVFIGYGTSAAKKNTYIDGYAVYLRTGTNHTDALGINTSGNVSVYNSLSVVGSISEGGVALSEKYGNPESVKKLVSTDKDWDTNSSSSVLRVLNYNTSVSPAKYWTGIHVGGQYEWQMFYKAGTDSGYYLRIYNSSNKSWKTETAIVHSGLSTLTMNGQNVITNIGSGTTTFNGTLASSSDVSQKNVIKDVELTVEQIAKSPAVNFTWKEGDDKQYVGTIAQYWKDVLPEVVSGDEGNLRMDYASLGVVNSIILARKVEEQDAVIKGLMNEIAELKRRL